MRWMPWLVVACSHSDKPAPAPSPTPTPVAAVDARPIDAPVAVAPIDASLAGYPTAIDRPTGCTLRGEWVDQPRELRFAPKDKPYGTVSGVDRAELVVGDTVFLQATTPTVTLEGYIDSAPLKLYAAKPFSVAGWVVPGHTAPLKFRGAKDERITFEVAMPEGVTAKTPVRDARPCSELAIDTKTEFEARDAIDAEDGKIDSFIAAKRAIPLSLEPGKPAVATLRYDDEPSVEILETKGANTRVVVQVNSLNPANNVLVFGWIPSNVLNKAAHGFGGSWATGGDRGARGNRSPREAKFVQCATDLPLVVEFEKQQHRVGSLAPKQTVGILPGESDYAEIVPHRVNVELAAGARWLAKRTALADCATVAAP